MARDYLAIQASSAESERKFSAGKLTLPPERNRLAPGMVRQLQLMKDWNNKFAKTLD